MDLHESRAHAENEYLHHFADKDGNKVDSAQQGLPPEMPTEMRNKVAFKAKGNGKTGLTITEYDRPFGQMMEMSKTGMEQCLDKMAASLAKLRRVCMRPQPLICVRDVEASSRWYQRLLGCQSAHGGPEYERLVSHGRLVLQLHRWDVGHHHGPIGDANSKPYGNGVLLWFELDDFDSALARAVELKAEVVKPRFRNPPSGDGGPNHWECWLRDPEGYTVVLASPDGSAGDSWRPAATDE